MAREGGGGDNRGANCRNSSDGKTRSIIMGYFNDSTYANLAGGL